MDSRISRYEQFITHEYVDGLLKGHEYSMWDFGDDRGEAWEMEAYDTPRTLLIHWALTGDRDYLDRGVEVAAHERDVDIEHSPQDTRASCCATISERPRSISRPVAS